MAIKFNSNRVRHLVKDGVYVSELKFKGTGVGGGEKIVWEETFGTYQQGTLPTGVASLTCNRVSKDPAVSSGTLASGSEVYNGDTLTFIATASSYFTVTVQNPSITLTSSKSSAESTIDGVTASAVSASGQTRTVRITINTGVQYIAIFYTKPDGTSFSTNISTSSTLNIFAGGKINWEAKAKSGYTMDTLAGVVNAGTSSALISPTATSSTALVSPSLAVTQTAKQYTVRCTNRNTVAVVCHYGTSSASLASSITISANGSADIYSSLFIGKTIYAYFSATGYPNSSTSVVTIG